MSKTSPLGGGVHDHIGLPGSTLGHLYYHSLSIPIFAVVKVRVNVKRRGSTLCFRIGWLKGRGKVFSSRRAVPGSTFRQNSESDRREESEE